MKVLVVDDEPTLLETIERKLRGEGFSVFTSPTAEEGMRTFRLVRPDLCVLDIMLPNRSGFDLCRAIRKEHKTPIIFLTARGSETDKVRGFDLGADDYMVKPFSLNELVGRIKAVLRRSSHEDIEEPLTSGNLTIDPRSHVVTVAGNVIPFAPKEFALLAFLARHAGQVFSREALLDRVWGQDAFVNSRTIDVHVRWIREQIEKDPSQPKRIVTVRGVGYKFIA